MEVGPRKLQDHRAPPLQFEDLITPGIESLRSVRTLNLVWAAKVDSLRPVFGMDWLERLHVSDFKLLREVDGIDEIENLRELYLSGNLGSLDPPMRLTSVRPIAKLPQPEKLELRNIRLQDDDISFVGDCFPKLRVLKLSSRFERRDFAYLARRLNAQLEEPITPSFQTNIECQECGRMKVMFVGRRMPILCGFCDDGRIRKLTQEFEDMMQRS